MMINKKNIYIYKL